MGSKRSISKDKLDDVCKSLKEKDFRDIKSKEWIKIFNDIPLVVRREVIKILETQQTLTIIKGMHELSNFIEVPFLGKFGIKDSRKDYIELRRENPDLSIEKIAEMVKSRYKEKLNKKKSKLNLTQVKNESGTSS